MKDKEMLRSFVLDLPVQNPLAQRLQTIKCQTKNIKLTHLNDQKIVFIHYCRNFISKTKNAVWVTPRFDALPNTIANTVNKKSY